MIGKKLISVYNRMNGVEKRAFSKFLSSPYYNHRPELQAYWTYLLRDFGAEGEKFDPKTIFTQLFPNAPFDLKQFRYISSGLLKKIEQFFVVRSNEKQRFENQLNLAKVYREKNIDHLFRKNMMAARAIVAEQKLDANRFYASYQLEFEQYAYIESAQRTETNNLQGLNDSLDQYLIVSKLKQSCLMLSHQAVYKVNYDFSFLNLILQFLEHSPLLENPAIGLYYHCYRAFSENDFSHFHQFKHLLTTFQDDFSDSETKGLLLFALNFCIRQINEGDPVYAKEAWDFYLLGINKKLLYSNDQLGRFTYKNIVALGIKLKEYHWTTEFIDQYKNDLPVKYRENYFNYNKAQLFFSQGKYEKAMPLLAMLDDSDLLLNFDAKVTLIKMYFELEELDALHSLLDSFSVMLQRKKVIGYHKNYYKQLIRLTKRLLDLPTGKSSKREGFVQDLLAQEKFPEKEWFLKMAKAF